MECNHFVTVGNVPFDADEGDVEAMLREVGTLKSFL